MPEHPRLIADNANTETIVAVLIALGEQLNLPRLLAALLVSRTRYESSELPAAREVAANLKAISDALVSVEALRDKQDKPQH